MKSPITGKEMKLNLELRKFDFRKESFNVAYHFYLCEESGEQFTTTEIENLNMTQLYNQYRDKHNLPFPDGIRRIRSKYGLPATKMSVILGFGINSYRNYESSEVPGLANARLIQLADDPAKFKELVELNDQIDSEFKVRLLKRIDTLIEKKKENSFSFKFRDYLLGDYSEDEFSGYKKPSLTKLTEMVVYFSKTLKPWKTQLNKLLFYTDFLIFKKTCFSMSGTRYRAINMGPVPDNFNSIFEYMENNGDVDIWRTQFERGEGEQFKCKKNRKFDNTIFSEEELEVLEKVAKKFKGVSTKKIIEYSHKEKAWKDNEKERKIISYKNYGFMLNKI